MTIIVRAYPRCRRCGGNIVTEDGERYCLLCGRSYSIWQDYGALGGQATLTKYGREHMVALGKRGGRPRLRHLPAPQTENNKREGMAAQPNNLKVLKELWRLQQRSKQEIQLEVGEVVGAKT